MQRTSFARIVPGMTVRVVAWISWRIAHSESDRQYKFQIEGPVGVSWLTVVSQIASSSEISQICTPRTLFVRQRSTRHCAMVVNTHARMSIARMQRLENQVAHRSAKSTKWISCLLSSINHFRRMNMAV